MVASGVQTHANIDAEDDDVVSHLLHAIKSLKRENVLLRHELEKRSQYNAEHVLVKADDKTLQNANHSYKAQAEEQDFNQQNGSGGSKQTHSKRYAEAGIDQRRSKCKYFFQGKCRFGVHCWNSHTKEVCRFHRRGSCRFGNRCWNTHQLDADEAEAEAEGTTDREAANESEVADDQTKSFKASANTKTETANVTASSIDFETKSEEEKETDNQERIENNKATKNEKSENEIFEEALTEDNDCIANAETRRKAENVIQSCKEKLVEINETGELAKEEEIKEEYEVTADIPKSEEEEKSETESKVADSNSKENSCARAAGIMEIEEPVNKMQEAAKTENIFGKEEAAGEDAANKNIKEFENNKEPKNVKSEAERFEAERRKKWDDMWGRIDKKNPYYAADVEKVEMELKEKNGWNRK